MNAISFTNASQSIRGRGTMITNTPFENDSLLDIYYYSDPICPDYLSAWEPLTNDSYIDLTCDPIGDDDDWLSTSFTPVNDPPTFLPVTMPSNTVESERVLAQINAWRPEHISPLTMNTDGHLYCRTEKRIYYAFIITTQSSDTLAIAKSLHMAHKAIREVPIEEHGTKNTVIDYTVEPVSPSVAATWLEDTLMRVTTRPGGRWFLL